MGLFVIEGDMGAGKSYFAVNKLVADFLRTTNRHVYTNLPCDGAELEAYLCWLTSNPAVREEMRNRLHFLYPGLDVPTVEEWVEEWWVNEREERLTRDQWPADEASAGPGVRRIVKTLPWPQDEFEEADYREQGYRIRRSKLLDERGQERQCDRLAEFWWFTRANAVVVLDESADLFKQSEQANQANKGKRDILRSYLNHHRHYRDDLYFFAQTRDELDVTVRKKIQVLLYVENMKKQPMFPSAWWARGLKWPVQHFRVREFFGRKVMGKGADFDRFEPLRSYRVWPRARGYRNYRSFCQSAMVAGKRGASGGRSSDLDSVWDRVKDFIEGAWAVAAVIVFAVFGVILGLKLIYGLAGVDSGSVASMLGTTNQAASSVAKAQEAKSNDTRTTARSGSEFYGPPASGPVATGASEEPERLLLTSSGGFVTSRRRVRVGDLLGGTNRVARILLDGIITVDGIGIRYELLLCGGGSLGLGGGASYQRSLQSLGAGVRDRGGAVSNGPSAGGERPASGGESVVSNRVQLAAGGRGIANLSDRRESGKNSNELSLARSDAGRAGVNHP